MIVLIYNKKFRNAFSLSVMPILILMAGLFGYLIYYMIKTDYFN